MYCDCHAHYHNITAEEAAEVIKGSQEEEIGCIITVGMDMETSEGSVKVAETYDLFYAAVGFHPWMAETIDDALYQKLKTLASNKRVVAISEIGLDYFDKQPRGAPDDAAKEVQKQALVQQLKLAKELGKPALIHNRASDQDLMDILRKTKDQKIVLHGFMGDEDMLAEAVDLGFYFTEGLAFLAPQIVREPEMLRNSVKKIPLDRLFLETDRFPQSLMGERPPWKVKEVARQIAEIKGITAEEIGQASTENVRRFLGIPLPV
ncbi:TatD family hydrolase [Chloroflexota bacterium]